MPRLLDAIDNPTSIPRHSKPLSTCNWLRAKAFAQVLWAKGLHSNSMVAVAVEVLYLAATVCHKVISAGLPLAVRKPKLVSLNAQSRYL